MTNPVHVGYGVTHTLEETAQLMGITRERVRQIEKRALEKLRAALKNRSELPVLRMFLATFVLRPTPDWLLDVNISRTPHGRTIMV